MKTIVIYKSRTGFTKRYAEWITEELKCDIKDYKDVSKDSLSQYDLVIFGGNLHAGKIDGLQKVKGLLSENKNCKLIVFATGATPLEGKEEIDKMWQQNLPGKELQEIPHYYMPGGLNYEKMGAVDRMMMKAFSKMMEKKKDKSEYEKGCEEAITSSYDISSKEYIKPLIQCLQKDN